MQAFPVVHERWFDRAPVKHWALILLLTQLIILLALLILVLASPNLYDEGGIGRELKQEIIFLGGNAPVTLSFNPAALPICPIQRSRTNVVILLDCSSSMAGAPFKDSIRAARSFVETADLSNINLALMQYSSVPVSASDFLNDREALLNEIDTGLSFVGGSTDLAAALLAARELLEASSAPVHDRNVILLFSDGGSEPLPAQQVADEFRDKGDRLIVIGLQGEDFDKDLLTSLVSSPGDLLLTTDSAQLSALFTRAASYINNTSGSDVRLIETYDPEQEEVIVNGSAIVNSSGSITWSTDALSSTVPYAVTYTVVPRHIGWIPVSDLGATLTANSCNQFVSFTNTHAGPNLLVLPPWWALLLWFGQTLLLGFMAFWPRPKKPVVYPDPQPCPDFKRPSLEPAWPLHAVNISSPTKPTQFAPTLILGLGPTGRLALREIRKNLLDVGQGQLPKGLKLLWIGRDIAAKDEILDSSELHSLKPKFSNIELHDLGPESSSFAWWEHAFGQSEDSRIHSRMAFYWDILFEHQNRLRNILSSIQTGFQSDGISDFQVYIIGAPGESDCVMLPDLAAWIQRLLPGQATRFVPWLLLSQADATENENPSAARYATMRELSRYMVGRNQLVETGEGLFALDDNYLFDGVMLFDEMASRPGNIQSVLESIADQMIGLLGQKMNVGFNNDLVAQMGMREDRQDQPLFITSLGHTFYWPIEPIRRVCEARLISDVLFSDGHNDVAQGIFASMIFTEEQRVLIALDFLRHIEDDLKSDSFPFRELADAADPASGWQPGATFHVPSNLNDGFSWKLMLALNREMNDLGSYKLHGRSGSLARAEALISGLGIVFQRARNALPVAGVPGKEQLSSELLLSLDAFENILNIFNKQIVAWTNLRTISEEGTKKYRWLSPDQGHSSSSLKERLDQLEQSCSLTFKEVLNPSMGRTIVLPVELANEISVKPDYAKIINYYYSRLIRSKNEITPIDRLASRIGWVWDMDDNNHPYLRLHILPADYDPEKSSWSMTRFTSEASDNLFTALMALAPRFSELLLTNTDITNLLNNRQEEFLQPLRSPESLLSYQTSNNQAYFKRSAFIAAPNSKVVGEWLGRLADTQFHLVSTDSSSRITALWFVYKVPFNSVNNIQSDRISYQPLPSLHAHLAEQEASRLDNELRNNGREELISPVTARLLSYPGLFGWATVSYLYGWLRRERDEWDRECWRVCLPDGLIIPLEDEAVGTRPTSLESALENFCLIIPLKSNNNAHALHPNRLRTTLSRFQENLDAERCRPFAERDTLYSTCESNDLIRLSTSHHGIERDFAACLRLLISKERLQ